jgi:hypothetical protein
MNYFPDGFVSLAEDAGFQMEESQIISSLLKKSFSNAM